MSNHTHRSLPRSKAHDEHLPSMWGGGVWQFAILAGAAIIYIAVTGWGHSDDQTSFRQAFLMLSLLAFGTAFVLQQLHRSRVAAEAKAKR